MMYGTSPMKLDLRSPSFGNEHKHCLNLKALYYGSLLMLIRSATEVGGEWLHGDQAQSHATILHFLYTTGFHGQGMSCRMEFCLCPRSYQSSILLEAPAAPTVRKPCSRLTRACPRLRSGST